jgi:tRNA A-37 threonylcarbamoyl transferase component Bud32
MGTVIGDRFLILERLGHGGSGTIYRAEHVTLRRKVAIKVLHHELSRDDLAVERFRREATTVSEIDNDHIVEIHDFGHTADGRLYLAMELLEGETLQDVIRREKRLGVELTLDVLLQLGEALAEAHAMGYVHRDLRPRNVWLAARRGRPNFVKLLDFGLAKLVEHEGRAASTSLGMTFGDPKYMSPEQARGEAVDRRADLYSMGCIAYEMLVGQPPFASGKVFDILTQHIDTLPGEPRDRREDVPLWLNSVIMRLLAKKAEDRFVTVLGLVEALRQQTANPVLPEEAAPASPAARAAGEEGGRKQRARTSTMLYGQSAEGAAEGEDEAGDAAASSAGIAVAETERRRSTALRKTSPGVFVKPATPTSAGADEGADADAVDPSAVTATSSANTLDPGAAARARGGRPPTEPAEATPAAAAKPAPPARSAAEEKPAAKAAPAAARGAEDKPAAAPARDAEEKPAAKAAAPAAARAAEEKPAGKASSRGEEKPAGKASSRGEEKPAGKASSSRGEEKPAGKASSRGEEKPAARAAESAADAPAAAAVEKDAARGKPGDTDEKESLRESGLSGDWFADAAGSLDESGRQRLDKARAFGDPADTSLMAGDDIILDTGRSRLIRIGAVIGGVILLIVLLALLWPSGAGKRHASATPPDAGTSAAKLLAEIDSDSGAAPAAPDAGAPATGSTGQATAATSAPAAGTSAPAAGTSAPATGTSAPATGTSAPAAGTSAPAAGTSAPATGTSAPAAGTSAPVAGTGARPPASRPETTPRTQARPSTPTRQPTTPREPREPDPSANPDSDITDTAKQAVFFAKMGEQALRNGDMFGAARHFKQALELDPKNADAILGQGQIAYDQGSYANAITHFEKAARMRPRNAQVHVSLGKAYLGAGNNTKAANSFKRALQLQPDDAQAQRGYQDATGNPPP